MFENKKLLIGIGAGLFVMIIVIVLVATKGKKPSIPGGGSQDGPNSVTLWTPLEDPSVYDPFMEKLNDKKIKLNIIKKEPTTYKEDLVNAIASGSGPDIFLVKNDWVPQYYGLISPKGYQASSYSDSTKEYKAMYPSSVATEMVGPTGDIFGYPLSSDPLVLYLNKGMLSDLRRQMNASEAGMDSATDELLSKAPLTWDDFKQVVRLTTRKNGTDITQAGAALGTDNNIESAQDILYLMMLQNGTKFISSDGKSAIFQLQQKSQKGTDFFPGSSALDLYTSFANPSSDVYTWNMNMPNAVDYFSSGKLAMMISYASKENYIQQMNPNLDYEVAALPQVRQTLSPNGFMQYYAMTVNRNSKNSNLAWDVVALLCDPNNRSKYLSATGRNTIFTEDLGTKKTNTIDGQIYSAKTVYKPDVVKYNNIFLKTIKDVTQGKLATQSSMENAARDITALLK